MSALRTAGHESDTFQHVDINVLNPKCVTMGELYGQFNELTQEWVDGLASTMIRLAAMTESGGRKSWTVFDGPIDALWIENMNTVLDDNMTLCLANGERIKLKPDMRMLFEVCGLWSLCCWWGLIACGDRMCTSGELTASITSAHDCLVI